MRNPSVLMIAFLSAPLVPAFAITLAPGQSGFPDLVANLDTGTTLAETTYTAYPSTSDFGIPETFESRVTRGSDGSLTFWYITGGPNPDSNLAEPTSVTLPGFAGLTTNIHQLTTDPFDPTRVILSPRVQFTVSRSADGNSITTTSALLPIDGPGYPYTLMSIYAVTTDAHGFQLNDTGYQPTYFVYPYPPPGDPGLPFLLEQPRPAFIPAIPEPLSLTTLPLAVAALCLRRRPLHV